MPKTVEAYPVLEYECPHCGERIDDCCCEDDDY
jgi:hypothetical protein